MTESVLWKRLTETDFNAMNAEASPHGAGGGARHIALGVRTKSFPIDDFLGTPGGTHATITAQSAKAALEPLDFYSNPERRGGEWTIRNQYSHRHPAWSNSEGFPTHFDPTNPPYILVFSAADAYFARFANELDLDALWAELPEDMLDQPRGIGPASPVLLSSLGIPFETLLDTFATLESELSDPFDPDDLTDGRRQVLAAIVRRQGQAAFRNGLIGAYEGRCAVTATNALWVLDAAHIVPYRGKETNARQNGLLLRADVHTLFDVGLVSVEPNHRRLRVSSRLKESEYWQLDGNPLRPPADMTYFPSVVALQHHFSQFIE